VGFIKANIIIIIALIRIRTPSGDNKQFITAKLLFKVTQPQPDDI